jgi:phosphatidylserine/phosphatidylglycerophosphate/cardiolipin synthase-like enzyme
VRKVWSNTEPFLIDACFISNLLDLANTSAKAAMDKIIAHLRESIADEYFSKEERKSLRELIGPGKLRRDELSYLRTKAFELAKERVTPNNYGFVIEWMNQVNNALLANAEEMSDAYFSPGESCREIIIRQISGASSGLKICVFTISDDRISRAIVSAHDRGVDVKIITDNDKTFDRGSDIAQLADAGIAVKMDSTPNHMHHKFMLVDNGALLTGSYNWTSSAARFNHENVLVTKGEKVVGSFLKEFDALWNLMVMYR